MITPSPVKINQFIIPNPRLRCTLSPLLPLRAYLLLAELQSHHKDKYNLKVVATNLIPQGSTVQYFEDLILIHLETYYITLISTYFSLWVLKYRDGPSWSQDTYVYDTSEKYPLHKDCTSTMKSNFSKASSKLKLREKHMLWNMKKIQLELQYG